MTKYRLIPHTKIGRWVLQEWADDSHWSYLTLIPSLKEAKKLVNHLSTPPIYIEGSAK